MTARKLPAKASSKAFLLALFLVAALVLAACGNATPA